MSATNTIERFGSKLDALVESNKAQMEALKESNRVQMDTLRESIRVTHWLLGVGITLIGIIVAYGTFFTG